VEQKGSQDSTLRVLLPACRIYHEIHHLSLAQI